MVDLVRREVDLVRRAVVAEMGRGCGLADPPAALPGSLLGAGASAGGRGARTDNTTIRWFAWDPQIVVLSVRSLAWELGGRTGAGRARGSWELGGGRPKKQAYRDTPVFARSGGDRTIMKNS